MLKEISLKDFNGYSLSRKDGCYAGDAGFKDGILIDNEYWMIKYPKNTTGMRGEVPSYTSSPLSEFIGSHIYDILGYDVHETVLGFKNNKIVVGCKDFCGEDGLLKEIRSLKNSYNENLENYLKVHLSGTGSDRFVDLDELLIHFEFNPILLKVPNLKNRFWDCVIIDGLINNNDRNNGNWGLLNRNGKEILSPIFDNGACFYNKQTDYDLERKLMNEKSLTVSSLYVATAYKKNNKPLFFKDILNFTEENADLQSSIKRVVPLIKKNLPYIKEFIQSIPEKYGELNVCSQVRKNYYFKSMEIRLEQLLEPVFNRILEQENNKKEPLNLQILEAANKQQNQNTDKENFNNEMER